MRCRGELPNLIEEMSDSLERQTLDIERENLIRWAMKDPRFTFEGMSFWDEEGVEGWKMTYQDREFYEVGGWDELPAIDDEALLLIMEVVAQDADCRSTAEKDKASQAQEVRHDECNLESGKAP